MYIPVYLAAESDMTRHDVAMCLALIDQNIKPFSRRTHTRHTYTHHTKELTGFSTLV